MFKNKVMKYFVRSILIAFFCIILNNCTPGMSLYFKNMTDEDIFLKYSLCNDLINENIEKTFEGIIEKDKNVRVGFIWNNFYNRGVTQDDYKYKETFLNIFEDIEIKKINSNEIITKDDLEKYELEYIKKGVSTHIFILKIL